MLLRFFLFFWSLFFRVRELLCAKMVVDKFLPFSFFSGNSWKDVMGLETADDTPYPALPSRRIKHLLVEMFVATKKVSNVFWHIIRQT